MRITQQWTLLAFSALAPLILFVLWGGAYLQDKLEYQHAVTIDIVTLNEMVMSFEGEAESLERFARQYIALNDERFRELYLKKRLDLMEKLQGLPGLYPGTSLERVRMRLEGWLDGFDQIIAGKGDGVKEAATVDDVFNQFNRNIRDLKVETRDYTKDLLHQSEKQFSQLFETLFISAVIFSVVTLILFALIAYAVARPVRSLGLAIESLGAGEWTSPVKVKGPKDIQIVGLRLEEARRQLVEAEENKQLFVRHITHELKSPLAAIIDSAELLLDRIQGDLTKGQERIVLILDHSARNLRDMIENLLNYNEVKKYEVGIKANVDLKKVCEDILLSFQGRMGEAGVCVDIKEEFLTVESDPALLDMIVANLLSNAFQFAADNGRVEIRWGECPEFWWLAVTDDGPGISEKDIDALFKPFYRGEEKSFRRGYRGSGIGLALVKECVERLSGDIQVVSKVGEGSRFEVRFPKSGKGSV